MPRYIVKLHDDRDNKDYYLEWSTIVDAPVTYFMSKKEFEEYYKEEYGNSGMHDLKDRMERVEEKGTSAYMYDNALSVIECNRAGENGAELSLYELIDKYKL